MKVESRAVKGEEINEEKDDGWSFEDILLGIMLVELGEATVNFEIDVGDVEVGLARENLGEGFMDSMAVETRKE